MKNGIWNSIIITFAILIIAFFCSTIIVKIHGINETINILSVRLTQNENFLRQNIVKLSQNIVSENIIESKVESNKHTTIVEWKIPTSAQPQPHPQPHLLPSSRGVVKGASITDVYTAHVKYLLQHVCCRLIGQSTVVHFTRVIPCRTLDK